MEASENKPFQSPAGGSPPRDIPKHETAAEQSPGNSLTVASINSNTFHVGSDQQTVQSGGVLESPEGEPDVSKATDSPAASASAATATAADPLTDEVKSKIDHPQDRLSPDPTMKMDGPDVSQTGGATLPVECTQHTAASLQSASLSIESRLALRLGTNVEYLHVCKSPELRETVRKNKLVRSISDSCHSWECKILLDVFKKGDIACNFYLHPNTGDQMQTAELRVQAKVSKSLFKKIKGYFQKCCIIVKAEVLDNQAGKVLRFEDLDLHWIDPTRDGTVNFNHNLAPCKPLLNSSSHNVDIVIKVIFIAQKPKPVRVKEGEDGWSEVSHM